VKDDEVVFQIGDIFNQEATNKIKKDGEENPKEQKESPKNESEKEKANEKI
jgi:hypothetical protein